MTSTSHRLRSLDVFRGVTIAAMIVVNNPGNWNAIYAQLSHAAWNGCTLADLVFPFFIFIMGMAMPLAFARRRDTASTRVEIHIWRRAAGLIALGLVLNVVAAWLHGEPLRLPGVLQRIGLTYLIAALVVLRIGPTAQIVTALALFVLQWAFLVLVPFGDHPAGTLTAAHNIGSYIDKAVFGSHTLTPTGDPEGLIGLAPSVATALLGSIAGGWLLEKTGTEGRDFSLGLKRLERLATVGLAAVAVGWMWSFVLPFNKQLWTGSYAVFASGLAALSIALCSILIDGRASRWSRPFLWLGANPLTIYFLSELVSRVLEHGFFTRHAQHTSPKDLFFWDVLARLVGDSGGARSSLLFAVIYTAMWMAVAGLIDRRMHRGVPAAAPAFHQDAGARA